MEGIEYLNIGENNVAYVYYNENTKDYRVITKKLGLGRKLSSITALTDFAAQNPLGLCLFYERGIYEKILEKLKGRKFNSLEREKAGKVVKSLEEVLT